MFEVDELRFWVIRTPLGLQERVELPLLPDSNALSVV